MTLKFLLEKEVKQFFRNPFMPKIVVLFPLVVMLLMPWAATLDIKNINTAIVDSDHSPTSFDIIQKIGNSSYFDIVSVSQHYGGAIEELEYGNADLIVEIPAGFGDNFVNLGTAPVQISVNTVNSIKGNMGQVYMSALLQEFSRDNAPQKIAPGLMPAPKVGVNVKNMYNPALDYKHTMIPGLMAVIMLIVCGFLPAVNIVYEKESGTIEQINVTPVRKATFVLAKLIPFWVIGFITLSLAFLLAWFVYGLTPAGNIGVIYVFAIFFILTMTGLGMAISNHSATMQQATFVMFFFVIIFVMMCGLLTPVSSMPGWARIIAGATPTKYMVDVMRSVYIRGSGLADLKVELLALAIMTVIYNVWAVASYRKYK